MFDIDRDDFQRWLDLQPSDRSFVVPGYTYGAMCPIATYLREVHNQRVEIGAAKVSAAWAKQFIWTWDMSCGHTVKTAKTVLARVSIRLLPEHWVEVRPTEVVTEPELEHV